MKTSPGQLHHGVLGHAHARGVMGRGMQGGISITRIMRFAKELELSDEQVQQLKRLESEYIRGVIRTQSDIRIAQLDLSDLFAAESPDFEKVRSLVRQINDLRLRSELSVVDAYMKGLDVLTGGQRARLSQLVSPFMQYGLNLPLEDEITGEETDVL